MNGIQHIAPNNTSPLRPHLPLSKSQVHRGLKAPVAKLSPKILSELGPLWFLVLLFFPLPSLSIASSFSAIMTALCVLLERILASSAQSCSPGPFILHYESPGMEVADSARLSEGDTGVRTEVGGSGGGTGRSHKCL